MSDLLTLWPGTDLLMTVKKEEAMVARFFYFACAHFQCVCVCVCVVVVVVAFFPSLFFGVGWGGGGQVGWGGDREEV